MTNELMLLGFATLVLLGFQRDIVGICSEHTLLLRACGHVLHAACPALPVAILVVCRCCSRRCTMKWCEVWV